MQVITFGPGYLMFPMHAAEEVTLLDKSILGDLTEALADAKAQAEGAPAGDSEAAADKIASQMAEASLEEAAATEPDAAGFFSLEQLQTAPFPAGVDKANRETFLDDATFAALFSMDKASFAALPGWKRTAAKKKHKLF